MCCHVLSVYSDPDKVFNLGEMLKEWFLPLPPPSEFPWPNRNSSLSLSPLNHKSSSNNFSNMQILIPCKETSDRLYAPFLFYILYFSHKHAFPLHFPVAEIGLKKEWWNA